MHEVNIFPPLSLAKFFLTQQLIYKSKTEKHNISLDIFVSGSSTARNIHLPGLEKKHFSLPIFFLDQILVFVLLKINERLRIRTL